MSGIDPFAETEDQATLRKFAREVAERELAPRAQHWDETEEFPQASWDALKQADLFGITVGEEWGGAGRLPRWRASVARASRLPGPTWQAGPSRMSIPCTRRPAIA